MSDLDKRLEKIEQQIRMNRKSSGFGLEVFSSGDEVDLRRLFLILWQGKWWIIGITFFFTLAGVIYATSLPNMYKSEGIYAPVHKQGGGGFGAQLGGLASFAGVNLGGTRSNDIDQAAVLINSWPFLEMVIDRYEMKPLIMAVKEWNRETDEFIWDRENYDPVAEKWQRKKSAGGDVEPNSYETYMTFRKMLSTSFDSSTNLLNITVEHYSPVVAKQWVDLIVAELNSAFRVRDMNEAKKNIEYLEKKILETSISEMQSVFYGMIETQMKTLMLAEVESQYLIREIVKPKVAEARSKPKRTLLCVLFSILGGFVAVFVVLARGVWLESKRLR